MELMTRILSVYIYHMSQMGEMDMTEEDHVEKNKAGIGLSIKN